MAKDILVVDDEEDIRELISGVLSDEGFKTRVAADSDQALDAVRVRRPNVLILDIWLQGSKMDGLELLDEVKRLDPELPVIIISGHGTIETAVSAIKRGAYDFIEKPFKADRLLLNVSRAIEAAELRRENKELRRFGGPETSLIGESSAIAVVRNIVDKVAPTGSRVLITGPAGCGKEVVARLLHSRSTRADGPFVVVNAASMAPERMEMELFGIEDRSGDPQSQRQTGLFERAHGGTLFIDEVADMPLETQGKILRVLVDQTFVRVGGSKSVEVDVRVISATSRELSMEIQAGRFRADLYHRLNVVPVAVPSLRERMSDIPLLVEYFINREAESLGLPRRTLTDEAMAALQTADWPGNVRELRNVVARLLILSPEDADAPIGVGMLPPEIVDKNATMIRPEGTKEIMTLPLREAREYFEREYLSAQIQRFGGNISRTANFIGMERSALHRKLKTLGVTGTERAERMHSAGD